MIRPGQDIGVRFPPSVIYGPDWPFNDPLPDEFWDDIDDGEAPPEQRAVPVILGATFASVGSSTIQISLDFDIVAGRSVFVCTSFNSTRTVSSVSDGTNTYVQAVSGGGASTTRCDIWWCANPAFVAATGSITVTLSGSATIRFAGAMQVASGVYTLGSTGTESRTTGASNCNVSTAGSVPAGATCMAGTIMGNNLGGTFAGWTDIENTAVGAAKCATSYLEVASPGVQTYASSGNSSNNISSAIAAFLPPGGTPASFPPVQPGGNFHHMLVR